MVSREIRFVSPDVALVDGVFTEKDGNGQMQTKALLLVMKKFGEEWKIAAVRIVAAQ
jgi:ketosteroid isomerase-like protein